MEIGKIISFSPVCNPFSQILLCTAILEKGLQTGINAIRKKSEM